MKYMNDYDLDNARRRFENTPNRLYLTSVVENLRFWTNHNSDGWAYWAKPVRAAARAIDLIESTTTPENDRRVAVDATGAEVIAALKPIKAFLTRQGVAHDDIIPRRGSAWRRGTDAPISASGRSWGEAPFWN